MAAENQNKHKPIPPPTSSNILAALPYDILHAIIAHIPDASSVANLSRTCSPLHHFVDEAGHGWQIFVQARFPSIYNLISPDDDEDDEEDRNQNINSTLTINWKQHADHLTRLSRNYDRRAFLVQTLDPEILVHPHPSVKPRGRGGRGRGAHTRGVHRWNSISGKGQQTVGFHPVLDATCSHATRGEVLAVGAGQDLLLRRRIGGQERWWLFEDRAHLAGRDDITALKLLNAHDGGNGEKERVLVGRANGALSVVTLMTERTTVGGLGVAKAEAMLETQGKRNVRAATLWEKGGDRLVVSVLGNDTVALHRLPDTGAGTAGKVHVPVAGVLVGEKGELPWNAVFLGPGKVAVGKACASPLTVHAITPTGLSVDPVRAFLASECVGTETSSVQPISAFPDIRGSPDVFLSGWYSGSTLLHDLRSPDPYIASFTDPLDPTSAIYSLLPLGRERILVGGARHNLLKVFDIRMPSGRFYFPPSETSSSPPPSSSITPGWATYLNPHPHHASGFTRRPYRPERESPVYSLAVGGAGGEKIFAGVEGGVWEFDFLGDGFGGTPRRRGTERGCTMYEFVGRTKLWRQGGEEWFGREGKMGAGGRLDGRWGWEGAEV